MKTIKKTNKPVSGTKEWATKNVNFLSGCAHDCRYCYAKCIAVRFKRKTSENWTIEELNPKSLGTKFRRKEGQIMFPSSHDLTPKHLDAAIIVLEKLLKIYTIPRQTQNLINNSRRQFRLRKVIIHELGENLWKVFCKFLPNNQT